MRRALLLLTIAIAVLQFPSAEANLASADCDSDSTSSLDSTVTKGGLQLQAEESTVDACPKPITDPRFTVRSQPICGMSGSRICLGSWRCEDGQPLMHYELIDIADGTVVDDWTGCPNAAPAIPQITSGMVARALRRVPLPPSELIIQPPDGRTLVNFDTNFYTRERTLFRSVRLLGQRVELRIVADSYTWHFGDGRTMTTAEAGAPYPKLTITHNYRQKGRFAPSLDTTYVADFRVGGDAWQPVPGSVTIEGEPEALQAIEATPTLVGYDG